MNFIGVIGDMGSGKTNFVTAIMKRSHDAGREIVANYKLTFPSTLMSFETLATLPPEIINKDVAMDELGTGADSYDFFDSQPRKLGKLVTQLRKRKCRVWYTVQRFSFITKRMRIMTDGFVLSEDMDREQNHLATGFICQGFFKLSFYTNDFVLVNSEIFDGRPYRNLYNTDEIIW